MSTVTCERCGNACAEGDSFCSACGTSLTGQQDFSLEETQIHVPGSSESFEDAEQGASFVVLEGAKAGSVFSLMRSRTTLGRHPRSDIFLDDITVSRRHAAVITTDGGHEVEDSGSLNGTYVNRSRVEKSPLQNGDIVQVGRFKLEYRGSE